MPKFKNSKPITAEEQDKILARKAINSHNYAKAEKDMQHAAHKMFEGAEVFNRGVGDVVNAHTSVVDVFTRTGLIIKDILSAIPWIATVALIYSGLFRAIMGVVVEKERASTRAIQVAAGLTGLGIGVASIVLIPLALPLLIAAVSVDTFQYLWQAAVLIKDKLSHGERTKRQKLSESESQFYQNLAKNPKIREAFFEYRRMKDKSPLYNELSEAEQVRVVKLEEELIATNKGWNAQRKMNNELGNKIHIFVLSAISVGGLALLLTPLAPIGVIVLLATAAYGVVDKITDKLKINPLRKLASYLFKEQVVAKPLPSENEMHQRMAQYGLVHAPQAGEVIHESTADVFEVVAHDVGQTPVHLARESLHHDVSDEEEVVEKLANSKVEVESEEEGEGEKINPPKPYN